MAKRKGLAAVVAVCLCAVLAIGLVACDGKLDAAKSAAIETISGYVSEGYTEACKDVVADFKGKIDAAADKAGIDKLVTEAKAAIDAKILSLKKTEAKKTLSDYAAASGYEAACLGAVADFGSSIDGAETGDALAEALAAGKTRIDEIKAVRGNFAGGAGTAENPYLVESAAQFANIKNYTNMTLTANFKLKNDIDFSGFTSSAGIENFNGTLDGDGHKLLNVGRNAFEYQNWDLGIVIGYFYGESVVKNLDISFVGHTIFSFQSVGPKLTFDNVVTRGNITDMGNNESPFLCQNQALELNFLNCKNYADLTGTQYIGVFLGGYVYELMGTNYRDGYKITYRNLENHGDVTGEYVSLLRGNINQFMTNDGIDGRKATEYVIENVVNYGKITGFKNAGLFSSNNTGITDATKVAKLNELNAKVAQRGTLVAGSSATEGFSYKIVNNEIVISRETASAQSKAAKYVVELGFSSKIYKGNVFGEGKDVGTWFRIPVQKTFTVGDSTATEINTGLYNYKIIDRLGETAVHSMGDVVTVSGTNYYYFDNFVDVFYDDGEKITSYIGDPVNGNHIGNLTVKVYAYDAEGQLIGIAQKI